METSYKKRCAYVHNGKFSDITVKDLIYTDELIFNIFNNIVNNINIFHSKDDLITFSKKVEAEKLLGLKSKVMPTKFTFTSKKYSEKDYFQI